MKKHTVVNLTKHDVRIWPNGNAVKEIIVKPFGKIARISYSTKVDELQSDIVPVKTIRHFSPVGLPDPEEGKRFIVSAQVMNFLPKRLDLLIPSSLIRDNLGRIVACEALIGYSVKDVYNFWKGLK